MTTDNIVIEREKGFWIGSAEYYERWLAQEVLMVFPEPAGVLLRDKVLAGIRAGARWASVEMSDICMRSVGTTAVMLSYRARARKAGSAAEYSARVGSVYFSEGNEWKLAFHQHTPCE